MNRWVISFLVLLLIAGGVLAQDTVPVLPKAHKLNNISFEFQGWNNCGPTTLRNALTYFGYDNNQTPAANWLKPNYEDKNVTPEEMIAFVNTQTPNLSILGLTRAGGTIELLKTLLANNFPVIIEKGYDPPPHDKGWMGHYLLMIGYDDSVGVFMTHDSFLGSNLNYEYTYIQEFWQHFNYTYIVLYPAAREAELKTLLGTNADETQNAINAFTIAQGEAVANTSDAFAWYNMGTNLVMLGYYEEAAKAYDQAISLGLPWRMQWYQFGPFEAYYHVGRYDDMLVLAQNNLNDGGGQYVEETYYYGGLAREAKGELARALDNYTFAATFNPNFTAAVEARDRLSAQLNGQDG